MDLALMVAGAICILVAATAFHPLLGLAVLGVLALGTGIWLFNIGER